jgi:hypothetical protein
VALQCFALIIDEGKREGDISNEEKGREQIKDLRAKAFSLEIKKVRDLHVVIPG